MPSQFLTQTHVIISVETGLESSPLCLKLKLGKKSETASKNKTKIENKRTVEKQRPYKTHALKKDECFYSISLPEAFIQTLLEAVKVYPVIALFGLDYRCQKTS